MINNTRENIIKPFMNGRSQAIRIPSKFRYNMEEELVVNKIGDTLIVTPKDSLKSSFEKSLYMFSDDFMKDGRPDEVENEKRIRGVNF